MSDEKCKICGNILDESKLKCWMSNEYQYDVHEECITSIFLKFISRIEKLESLNIHTHDLISDHLANNEIIKKIIDLEKRIEKLEKFIAIIAKLENDDLIFNKIINFEHRIEKLEEKESA